MYPPMRAFLKYIQEAIINTISNCQSNIYMSFNGIFRNMSLEVEIENLTFGNILLISKR